MLLIKSQCLFKEGIILQTKHHGLTLFLNSNAVYQTDIGMQNLITLASKLKKKKINVLKIYFDTYNLYL